MFKLVSVTLFALFLTLLIAGRPDPPARTADAAAPPVTAPPVTHPAAQVIPAVAPAFDPTPDPAPVARIAAPMPRMPGPTLRPSPEYRAVPVAAVTTGAIFTVTANRLNVRAGPSTGQAVLTRITRGEEVLVLTDPARDWVQIRIEGDGIEGWVSRKLLRPGP